MLIRDASSSSVIPFPTNNYTFRKNNLEDEILKKNQYYQAIRMIFI